MSKQRVRWSRKPARKDFAAAHSYLSLLFPAAQVTRLVRSLQHGPEIRHAAKDLLRASGLPLLPRDEAHVAADLKRIHKGKLLSPVLLVRGDHDGGRALLVADGYHRICAACHFDEEAPIRCLLVSA